MLQLVHHLVSHGSDEHPLGHNQRVNVNVGHLLVRTIVAVSRGAYSLTGVGSKPYVPKLALEDLSVKPRVPVAQQGNAQDDGLVPILLHYLLCRA